MLMWKEIYASVWSKRWNFWANLTLISTHSFSHSRRSLVEFLFTCSYACLPNLRLSCSVVRVGWEGRRRRRNEEGGGREKWKAGDREEERSVKGVQEITLVTDEDLYCNNFDSCLVVTHITWSVVRLGSNFKGFAGCKDVHAAESLHVLRDWANLWFTLWPRCALAIWLLVHWLERKKKALYGIWEKRKGRERKRKWSRGRRRRRKVFVEDWREKEKELEICWILVENEEEEGKVRKGGRRKRRALDRNKIRAFAGIIVCTSFLLFGASS